MLCTTWEMSCSLLDPEKQSGGFLRAKGRGVTWGWCVHELSTTLVQIPGLNIGAGHCQLSSVTRTLRGSSCGRHPSSCLLACVKQILTQALLLGLPAQHPPDGWWRSYNTFLQPPWRWWAGAEVVLHGGLFSQGHVSLSRNTAEQSSGCLNLSQTESQITPPWSTSSWTQQSLLHSSKTALKICYGKSKFYTNLSENWILTDKWTTKIWRRIKAVKNKIPHSKNLSFRF